MSYQNKYNSPLRIWAKNNNFIPTKNSGSVITHTCLDGGTYNIPDSRMDEFFKKYIESIRKGFKLFVCETTKQPTINFYCDLDFKEDTPICYDDIKDEIQFILKTVCQITNDEQISAMVCISKSRKIDDFIKSGFHIIWTDLILEQSDCIYLRNQIVNALNKKIGNQKLKSSWDSIIDGGVYNTGLRMIGSYKQDIQSKYTPYVFISPHEDGILNNPKKIEAKNEQEFHYEFIKGPMNVDILKKCSIVNFYKLEPIYIHKEKNDENGNPIPMSDDVSAYEENKMKKRGIISSFRNKEGKVLIASMDQIELRKIFYDYIVKHLPKYWHDCRVGVIKPNDKPGEFYCAIHDNNYCTNIGALHSGVGVYFLINPEGLRQQCYCECNNVSKKNTTGTKILCKHYSSNLYKLSADIFRVFYPDKKQKIKDKPTYEQNKNIFKTSDYNQLKDKNNKKKYLDLYDLTLESIQKKCR